MTLSIRQLEAFREIVRTGSITEAAKGLHRTPASSQLINQ